MVLKVFLRCINFSSCMVFVVASLHYSLFCVSLPHPIKAMVVLSGASVPLAPDNTTIAFIRLLTYPEFLATAIGAEKVKMLGNPAMEAGDARLREATSVEEHGVNTWVRGGLFKLSKGHVASKDTYAGCIDQPGRRAAVREAGDELAIGNHPLTGGDSLAQVAGNAQISLSRPADAGGIPRPVG